MSEHDTATKPVTSTPVERSMRSGRLWDTVKLSRWLRRLALPFVLLAFVWLYLSYGVRSVPTGMDTLPKSCPVGSFCAVQKNPTRVRVGSVVFVDVGRGALLLSQVSALEPDGRFQIRHENRRSAFLQYETQGPYKVEQVRELVLGVFRVEGSANGR